MNDPFNILGVTPDASLEQIHAAFRKRASENHPDLGGDKSQFQQINSAYQFLLQQREREEQKAKLRAAAFAEQKRKDALATAESALAGQYSEPSLRNPDSNHGRSQKSGSSPKPKQKPPKPTRTEARSAQAARAKKRSQNKGSKSSTSFFTRALPLQSETSWFILANALDIFLTHLILEFGGKEANPIAKFFIDSWGYPGMIAFKLCLVAFVCVVAQVIAIKSIQSAGRLLIFGTLLVAAVVIYSAYLLSGLLM